MKHLAPRGAMKRGLDLHLDNRISKQLEERLRSRAFGDRKVSARRFKCVVHAVNSFYIHVGQHWYGGQRSDALGVVNSILDDRDRLVVSA